MRINFLLPDLKISGGVKVGCEYARRLAQKGHLVTITSRQKRWASLRNIIHTLVNTVRWIDLKNVQVKFVPSYDQRYIPDADVVLATSWKTAIAVNKLSPSKGRKYYLVQHIEDMISKQDTYLATQTYFFPLTKIAVSNWIKEELQRRFTQTAEYLPVAIDQKEFFPENKIYGTKRIGMLYHTADWKGVADGLKALEIVRKYYPEIKLVMFGARHRRPKVEKNNFEYYHRPTGAKLRKIYSTCDIFISPSWYEGFGLPALEAMACKAALVTTDNGGCRDYAIHNQTALVSPIKNPEALAENIIKLLNDPLLLRRLSEAGYQMAQKFNWEYSLSKMEEILQKSYAFPNY